MSLLYQGMYLHLHKRVLTCYGLGIISYKDKYIVVVMNSEIDTCIQSIGGPGPYDVGIKDFRGEEESLMVHMNTYASICLLTCLGFTGYAVYKKLG